MKLRKFNSKKEIEVVATSDHPDCPINQSVWVDKDNKAYGVVGAPIVGYEVVYTTHPAVGVLVDAMNLNSISIYKLSQLSGVSGTTISAMVSGKSTPNLETLDKLCTPLGLKIMIVEEKK